MNELRTILADTCTRLFTDRVTQDLLEHAEKGAWPGDLWQAVEESGLSLPQIAEAHGGAGGSWQDAQVVLFAAGRFAVPLPIGETMIAAWLLAEAGLEVPLGPLTVAPVRLGERLTLARTGAGWTVSGAATRVPWGGASGHVVVAAEGEGRPMVALVKQGQARVEGDVNLALEPRDTLVFERAPVEAAGPTAAASATPWHLGALIRSAQMAGGLEALLAKSARYVTERKQFGRPLSHFQAVQQNLALLAGHTAAAGMAAQKAFQAMPRGDAVFEIAVAKIRTGEAAGLGAGIAHQAHGAIGFTYEHTLHFNTRRLWSWRAEFGAESYWSEHLGREVAARGPDQLWPLLASR
jgi:acyl-CoA dehydrogenase